VPGVVILDRVIEAAEAWCGHALSLKGLPQARFLAPLLPGEPATVTLVRRDSMLDFTVHRATTLVSRGTLALHTALQP
jgi:3-hydroxymyristoyl/3-hydroxydecanoyl-(acyl carrier protein) dehydratase